mmetsp:Transcript_32470/g.92015  ORF Transcript_32470/g.92015 Transcript_32470/m.92015 type:complete len:499 (-) Transcript_32470:1478-2974(-)|eukprot:CAMPEP_0117672720 /NCGR_PEP_ID=MMETSP0804-20121206/14066_1 /TAXON_ID=1074897 /ORGANISM="Tetraselmis astigmatica, Strain CCMP880" /LENGTH=498 /DNA_ID=CAMNT_0005481363 /DNA_START=359 /DNA_END=1855 /DNA_ORIENTATION=+
MPEDANREPYGGADKAADDEEMPLLSPQVEAEGMTARSTPWCVCCQSLPTGGKWFMAYAALGAVLLLSAICLGAGLAHHGGNGKPSTSTSLLALNATSKDLYPELLDDKRFRDSFEDDLRNGIASSTREADLDASIGYVDPCPATPGLCGVVLNMHLGFPEASEDKVERLASKLKAGELDGRGLLGDTVFDKYGQIDIQTSSVRLVPTSSPTPAPTPPPDPTPTPMPDTPTPTPGPTPPPKPTPDPGPPPSPTPMPPKTPEPTPAPAEPTPTPAPTTPAPTPAPTACMFFYVVEWRVYMAPRNKTHWYNTTAQVVKDMLSDHLDLPSEEQYRIRATKTGKAKRVFPDCTDEFEEEQQEVDDDEEQVEESGVAPLGSQNAGMGDDDDIGRKKKKKKKPAKVDALSGHMEILLDSRAAGKSLGDWLITTGHDYVGSELLRQDAELCGAEGRRSFVGRWKKRCFPESELEDVWEQLEGVQYEEFHLYTGPNFEDDDYSEYE